MTAPRLTRRLTLEAPAAAPDGAGGLVEDWAPLGLHWAALVATRGGERVSTAGRESRVSHRAFIRWAAEGRPERPTPAQRFREGGRVFDILAVTEADGERRRLVCWLEERRPA